MEATLEKPATRPKPRGGKLALRPNIAAARLDYLHGINGAPPNRTVMGLCETHGIHHGTIRKYLPEWEKDLESLVTRPVITESVRSLSGGSSLTVPIETVNKHKTDIDFIRNELDDIKNQMSHLAETTSKLENMVETLSDKDMDKGLRLFENYLRACANKASLQKRFMVLQPLWSKLVGIDSLMEIQVAGAKAVAVASAKAGNDNSEPESESVSVGFKRRS